ncbi:hypothetical protein AC624_25165 [Bacillus sp. FJAT-27238]|nr:hypothetical protein AC624_25165 [Bacillus sp. FJAT-27238]
MNIALNGFDPTNKMQFVQSMLFGIFIENLEKMYRKIRVLFINKKSHPIQVASLYVFWWRRGDSNPRPKTAIHEHLRAQSLI